MKKLKSIYKAELIPIVYKKLFQFGENTNKNILDDIAEVWCNELLKYFPTPSDVVIILGEGTKSRIGKCIGYELTKRNINVKEYTPVSCLDNAHLPENVDLVIDAIWDDEIDGNYSTIIEDLLNKQFFNDIHRKIVSIDSPSGLSMNNIQNKKPILKSNTVISTLTPRLLLLMPESADYYNQLIVPSNNPWYHLLQDIETPYYFVTESDIKDILPTYNRFAHKGTNGRGVILAGSYGMMGAACLCAKGAINSGIGLLTTHIPKSGVDILQSYLPESLVSPDSSESHITTIPYIDTANAIAIGPGIGQQQATIQIVQKLLSEITIPCIIDADGLNIISKLCNKENYIGNNTLLTPHIGEFERLTGKSVNSFERLTKLCTFVSQYQTTVLLKGAYSVVADKTGKCYFNIGGTPAMAKGGSGDVLAGIILALVSGGISIEKSAIIGMYAHARAGEMAQKKYGKRGTCSGDIATLVKDVWYELEQ